MRILVINMDYQPQFLGGIKRVDATLAKAWREMGHEVKFVCMCPSTIRQTEVEGTPQVFFPCPEQHESEENVQFLCRLIKDWGTDILLQPHVEEEALSRLCIRVKAHTGVSLVAACHFAPTHDLDIARCFQDRPLERYSLNNVIQRIIWKISWFTVRRHRIESMLEHKYSTIVSHADKFVVTSKGYVKDVNRLSHNEDPLRVTYIHNPFILSTSQLGWDSEKQNYVMWCGRVEYGTKRLDRMLSIWKRVCERFPDWELIIMGSGDTTRFEALVHKHGIQHVRFIGFCNPFDWYEKGKILCVTSSAEGWGLTLVEAMSQGCATMAYGSYAAVHDIINDGKTGYIVPPYNEKLFVEHLAQLMENEEMCAQMGMAGKESLHRFDIHTTAQKYIDVFSEVIRQ